MTVVQRFTFEKIQPRHIADDIVLQIKQALANGVLRVGDRLPVQRELREGLGVSRSSVRDGVRTLQAMGLVDVRIGAKGGAFVTCPRPDHVSELLQLMLTMSDADASEISQSRALVELSLLPMVCQRATSTDLLALERLCEPASSRHPPPRVEPDEDTGRSFHVRLAEASHSSVLPILLAALSNADGAGCTDPASATGVRDHLELLAAIAERDAARAHAVLARHLGVEGRVTTVALEPANLGPAHPGVGRSGSDAAERRNRTLGD